MGMGKERTNFCTELARLLREPAFPPPQPQPPPGPAQRLPSHPEAEGSSRHPDQIYIHSRLRITIIWERVNQVRAPDGRRAALA